MITFGGVALVSVRIVEYNHPPGMMRANTPNQALERTAARPYTYISDD
jgi:hypothetical protein